MEPIFNCPVCQSELKIGVVNIKPTKKKSDSRLDDAMVIVHLCSEKVRDLSKRKTPENIKQSKEITESIQNLLSDVLDMPDGVKSGIMDEIQTKSKKSKSKTKKNNS